jgi:hypothetical protein
MTIYSVGATKENSSFQFKIYKSIKWSFKRLKNQATLGITG